jgi:predicted permease
MNLALKEGGDRSSTSGRARNRVRRGLVVAEVAFAVMLVVGAGLLLRSFWNLMQVDSGFDRSRLVTFGLVLPASKYNDMEGRAAFFRELTSKLRELPGVEGAAAMSGLPPQRQVNANDTDFDGYAPTSEQPAENVDYYQMVTADYLPAMGIPVVEGRGFSVTDDAGATPVAVVNQTLARTFFPGQSPVGRRVKPGFGDGLPWFTIIGVVKDVKQGGLDQKTGTEIYFHTEQLPAAVQFAPNNMNVVLRTTRSVPALAASIRSTVRSMDPGLPIIDLRTMDEVFSDAVVRPRFLAQLLGIFAALALALAAVGTYGILSYMVTERRREIGIRMALGADVSEVMSLVLGQGFRVTLLGLVLGVLGALALNRLAASLLFGVAPTDPMTFLAVSAFITAVALVACLVPARRATRVDPMVALRDE